jgi:hypothetical protein
MNFKFAALVALTSLNALAAGPFPYDRAVYQAELSKAKLHKGLHIRKVQHAEVLVDFRRKEAVLTIQPARYCPPNALCSMEMPRPMQIVAPIKSVKDDGCGSILITAVDAGPGFDRGSETIEILDNTKRRCEDNRPFDTEVRYVKHLGLSGVMLESRLAGERLLRELHY